MNHHIPRVSNNVPLECEWKYPSNNGEALPKIGVTLTNPHIPSQSESRSHDSRSLLACRSDSSGDGYLNESISQQSNEKEPYKYRYLIEEVQPPEKK